MPPPLLHSTGAACWRLRKGGYGYSIVTNPVSFSFPFSISFSLHSDRIARTIRRAKQQMRRLPRVGLPCWMLEWWMLAEWVMFNGPRTKFDWAQATVCGHTLKRQQSQTGEIIECIADKATSADWIFMPARQSKRCKFGQSILFYSPSVGKNFPLMLPAACGQLISLFRNLVPEITEYYTKVYLWEHLYSVGKKI